MLTLLLIANDPAVVAHVIPAGVGRIMVDTEILGKAERQAGKDMLMSSHTVADVAAIRAAVPQAEVMLRVNPVHPGTAAEIAAGAAAGAHLIMAPMLTTVAQTAFVAAECQRHGLGFVPLVETPAAFARLDRIVELPGVTEVYLGLNDLHLGLGLDFLFEPVAAGLMDHAAAICRAAGKPFGFGGIAGMPQPGSPGGAVPGDLVLAEHVRLGSTRVILSRAFTQRANTIEEFRTKLDFPAEVARLRTMEAEFGRLPAAALAAKHQDLRQRVAAVVEQIQAKKSHAL